MNNESNWPFLRQEGATVQKGEPHDYRVRRISYWSESSDGQPVTIILHVVRMILPDGKLHPHVTKAICYRGHLEIKDYVDDEINFNVPDISENHTP